VNRLDALIKRAISEHRTDRANERWKNINNKNPYNFYKTAQTLLKPKDKQTNYPIKDKQGNPIHDDNRKAREFEELYKEIYQPPPLETLDETLRKLDRDIQKTTESITKYNNSPYNYTSSEVNGPISEEDIIQALKQTKNTAPGEDKIFYQHLRELPRTAINHLSNIYSTCLKINYFPEKWKLGITTLIPKPN
jgi:hypothetical protein